MQKTLVVYPNSTASQVWNNLQICVNLRFLTLFTSARLGMLSTDCSRIVCRESEPSQEAMRTALQNTGVRVLTNFVEPQRDQMQGATL